MFAWFRNKNELQKLQSNYCKLMKTSYKLALKDKPKSDKLHEKAGKIMMQIKQIEEQ